MAEKSQPDQIADALLQTLISTNVAADEGQEVNLVQTTAEIANAIHRLVDNSDEAGVKAAQIIADGMRDAAETIAEALCNVARAIQAAGTR